jgi:hypothetical protein
MLLSRRSAGVCLALSWSARAPPESRGRGLLALNDLAGEGAFRGRAGLTRLEIVYNPYQITTKLLEGGVPRPRVPVAVRGAPRVADEGQLPGAYSDWHVLVGQHGPRTLL